MESVKHYTDLLLAPVTNENAVGKSLRYEDVYENIKEIRRTCGSVLDNGGGTANSLESAASQLCEECQNALSLQSKDFLVAVWWVEGLFLRNGILGLLTGIKVLKCFTEKYWSTAFPLLSENDQMQARVQIFDWFDKTVSKEALLSPILVRPSAMKKVFNLFEIGKINQLSDKFGTVRKSQIKQSDRKLYDQFKKDEQELLITLDHAPKSYFETEVQNTLECCVEIESLAENLSSQYQLEFSNFDSIIKNLKKRIQFFKKHQGDLKNSPESVSVTQQVNTLADVRPFLHNSSKTHDANEPRFSTDEVLKYLNELNDADDVYLFIEALFKKLEVLAPHSPVPLFGKKVMSLKDMTFLDVMESLIDDERSLLQLKKFLGVSTSST